MGPWDIDSPALELLENVCSFALGARPSGLSMLPETADLEVFAGDGSGGPLPRAHTRAASCSHEEAASLSDEKRGLLTGGF